MIRALGKETDEPTGHGGINVPIAPPSPILPQESRHKAQNRLKTTIPENRRLARTMPPPTTNPHPTPPPRRRRRLGRIPINNIYIPK